MDPYHRTSEHPSKPAQEFSRKFFAGILEQSMGAKNRVGTELSDRPASLYSLAGRYDNPFPTRFLAPIDCSKIPALNNEHVPSYLAEMLEWK